MYGNFQALDVERCGTTAWVHLGEAHLNTELAEVFRRLNADPEIRAVVLTGAEERAFCVGGGGAGAPRDEAGRNAYWFRGMAGAREVILSLLDCDKPIIGRINGHAVGKGCSIALCCDITVMVADAKIGDTHVKVGLACGDGGSLLWPNLVGPMLSKRYLLTGDLMTGQEAAAVGLVTEAVTREDLDARIDYWRARLDQGSPTAVAMTKRALNAALRQQAIAHMDLSLGLETLSFLTEDHREGAAALSEKRRPEFVGR